MKALEKLKDYIEDENRLGDLNYAHYSNIIDYVNEAIEEIKDIQKEIQIITDDERTLTDFVFTNCNECINKVDNHFTETCLSCTRYYGCYFEKKETK